MSDYTVNQIRGKLWCGDNDCHLQSNRAIAGNGDFLEFIHVEVDETCSKYFKFGNLLYVRKISKHKCEKFRDLYVRKMQKFTIRKKNIETYHI